MTTTESPLVLVVEDDEAVCRVTCAALSTGQFRVIDVGTGQRALAAVVAQHPDVILLDLGLPDMSGLDVIHQLGNSHHPPIVVYSAGSRPSDILTAIEAGAVDFVAKPFVIDELLSRVRSVVRSARARGMESASHFTFDDLVVDLCIRRVSVGNRTLQLSSSEFRLLEAFVRNAGRLLTYRVLIREIRESGESLDDSDLMTMVSHLRNKLEPDPLRPRFLFAEPGIGYRFQ